MPRRRVITKSAILPDPKFGSEKLTKFINQIMSRGKKSIAERIIYGALDRIEQSTKEDPIEVFQKAIEKVSPNVEVKSRRVGGANYQVPVEVRANRRDVLAMRWLVECSRKRREKTMAMRLAGEMIEAADGRGAAFKKKEDIHKMAAANQAYSHYRF